MEFRKLKAAEIECRAAQITEKGISLLLYKDARVDQRILDETVGPMNWQRHHTRDNANCVVSIWDQEKGQWIEKEDTGTESNTEAEKGLASDSFKRACFNWGIGRELYTSPFIWIKAEDTTIKEAGVDARGKKRFATNDRFKVAAIAYDQEGNIKGLAIRNSKNALVYTYGQPDAPQQAPKAEPKAEPEVQDLGKQKIDTAKVAALTAAAKNNGISIEKILTLYKVKSLADLNEKQFSNINANWEKIKNA